MAVVKIVVLTTDGSHYGLRLLNALHREGVSPDRIVVRRDSFARKLRLLMSVARRIGWLDAAVSAVRAVDIKRRAVDPGNWRGAPLISDYSRFSTAVMHVEDFHSAACLAWLQELENQYCLLAQTGIVRKSLIRVAEGVLNAHPGWLPFFRGVDIPWWTLYEGKPELLGSTLHFVDAGVDTGSIVEVRPFRAERKPPFDMLEEYLYEDCVDLLAKAAHRILSGESLPRTPQRKSQGKQYYKMPVSCRRQALAAYRQWQLGGNDTQN